LLLIFPGAAAVERTVDAAPAFVSGMALFIQRRS
jgi:hypothetical protein